MTGDDNFIDYYRVLGVDPDCSPRRLEGAYRALAKQFHPDHPETADVTKLNYVLDAYRVLRDAEKRAEYDLLHAAQTGGMGFKYFSQVDATPDQTAALDDGEMHQTLLLHLYKRRRESPREPGVGDFVAQELLNCSNEHFAFIVWYLKAKGFIEGTEQGTLAITIQGVDQVISLSRQSRAEQLRIGQLRDVED